MVIVKFIGGLGNQLFQYSFVTYLSKNLNEKVYIDIGWYRTKLRDLHMDALGLSSNYFDESAMEKIVYRKSRIFNFLNRAGLYSCPKHINHYEEDINLESFFKETRRAKDYHCFNGWWAKKEYVDAFINEKKMNYFSTNQMYHYWKDKIINCKESVSVHVRRTDYINNQDVFKVQNKQYYHDALEFVSSKLVSPEIFIFSDDMEWCKSNFTGPYHYVSADILSDTDEFDLMRNCSHNIIANSTFSWWAAKLNEFKDKIIVMPMTWFNSEELQESYITEKSVLGTLSTNKL